MLLFLGESILGLTHCQQKVLQVSCYFRNIGCMNLAWLMKSWRHFNGFSMKEAAEKVGIPSETYRRLEEGSMMRGETLAAVLRWILS